MTNRAAVWILVALVALFAIGWILDMGEPLATAELPR